MSGQSYNDKYEYELEQDEYKRQARKFKKAEPVPEKKKKWERESFYDRDSDHNERR
jgi:hypothetical protein